MIPDAIAQHLAVDALGWTLVHCLWQGAALAALLAGSLRLCGGRSSQVRHLAGCATLLAMLLAPATTFALLRTAPVPPARAIPPALRAGARTPWTSAAPAWAASVRRAVPSIAGEPMAANGASGLAFRLLAAVLPWLAILWMAGVLLQGARLLGGWAAVQRLRARATGPARDGLEARAAELARRLGIGRAVPVQESAGVIVPMVIGCARPVILMPAGVLSHLSSREQDALLAHELAHVRRHDPVVNLLQAAVETLLFFHPAVAWVSQLVRMAREECCDDLAVSAMGDRVAYARALAALEELRAAAGRLALAASEGESLDRIRRLLALPHRDPPLLTLAGWTRAILLPLLLVLLPVMYGPAARGATPEGLHSSGTQDAFRQPMPARGLEIRWLRELRSAQNPKGRYRLQPAPSSRSPWDRYRFLNAGTGRLVVAEQALERAPVIVTDAGFQPAFRETADPLNGGPALAYQLTPAGKAILSTFTRYHVGARLAIVLGTQVLSAPRVDQPIISGRGILSMRFATEQQVRTLAARLNTTAGRSPSH